MNLAAKKNNEKMDAPEAGQAKPAAAALQLVGAPRTLMPIHGIGDEERQLIATAFPQGDLIAQRGPFAWWADRHTPAAPTFLCRLSDLTIVRLDELAIDLEEQMGDEDSSRSLYMAAANRIGPDVGGVDVDLTVEEAFAQGDAVLSAFAEDLQAEFGIVDMRPYCPHLRLQLNAFGPGTRVRRHQNHLLFALAPPAGHGPFGHSWAHLRLLASPAAAEGDA